MCHDERYYKSVLYTIQALPTIDMQYNLIETVLQINLYFAVRIAHQTNTTDHFHSVFLEKLNICLKKMPPTSMDIDEIITPLYISIILQEEECFNQLISEHLIPLLRESDNRFLKKTLSIMYDSLEKSQLIRFFSILTENKLFDFIEPNRIYGQCTEFEKGILRSMLICMSMDDDVSVMQKMVSIGFRCRIEGLFPEAFNMNLFNKKKYTNTWSVSMYLYIYYGILDGDRIPDELFPKIMRKINIIVKPDFYNFLTEYSQHYTIPDEAIYTLIVSSRVNKEPVLQECVNRLLDENTQSKLSLQMQQNLKIVDFYNMCRNVHYINVVQFMIQNNPDENSRRLYFSTLAQSNIFLAAKVINSTYCNYEELEKLFNSILVQKLKRFSNISIMKSIHPQELNHIVAALLIIGRNEEFESFMKDVFCPYIMNNKTNLSWFANNISSDMIFKLVYNMAINRAVSKIIPSLILECKITDEHALNELLQTVYYDSSTKDVSKPLRLTILMAEKYGVDNLAKSLNTTDKEINERIRSYLRTRHISLTNKMHMLYLSFLEFRKPFEQLNEQELKHLNSCFSEYHYHDNTQLRISPYKSLFQNILLLNHDIPVEFKLLQQKPENEHSFNADYIPLLQDENHITTLLNKYHIEYNANWHFQKWGKINNNADEDFYALHRIFDSYKNIYNIIRVFFSLLQLYSFPLESGVRYLYEKREKNNDYLRHLLNDIVLSGLVRKTTDRCIYVFPASFLSMNTSLPVIWCNGKVRSNKEDVIPIKKEWIYCKIHSYIPQDNTVLLRCPSYSIEECKHYNSLHKLDIIKENQ